LSQDLVIAHHFKETFTMAGNLNRLRSLVLAADADLLLVASLIFHCSPEPTLQQTITAPEVLSYIEWMARSPYPAYGRFVGKSVRSREELSDVLSRVPEESANDIADLVNSMHTIDSAWDKSARAAATSDTVMHSQDSALLAGQSAIEFVALETIIEAGYPNLSSATTSIDLLIKSGAIDRLSEDTLQLRRSRKMVASSWVESTTGIRRHFVSPWFLSKQSCLCLMSHYVKAENALRVEKTALKRGHTAVSYEARAGLQAVRSVLEPAISILQTCTYNHATLCFVDNRGRKAYDIATRTKHVLVAFSYVFSRGSSDVLLELARMRRSLQTPEITACPSYWGFQNAAEVDVAGMLVLFARTLHDTRDDRLDMGYGDGFNKPPCIGMVIRARGDEERNTLACTARVQEVVSLMRYRGEDVSRLLFSVHWEGDLDPDVVMASLAVCKIDVAIDVGAASVNIPGSSAKAESGESSYIVLLASAEARGLSRIVRLPYPSGLTVEARLELLAEFYTAAGEGSIVYLGGGSPFNKKPATLTCSDARSIAVAVSSQMQTGNVTFGSTDFIMPNLCTIHGRRSNVDHALECNGMFEVGCHNCDSFGLGLRDMADMAVMAGARFVKPRSAYAHNGNFAIELYGTGDPHFDGTIETVDTTNFMTAARNVEWTGDLLIPERGDPYHKNFMDAVKDVTRRSYEFLAGNQSGPVPEADLASVAQSVN